MSRACHFNLVAKHSLVLKLKILQVEIAVFLLLLCCKKEDFWRGPTFKICNFKPSESFPTKVKRHTIEIYEIEWPKVNGHYWPLSIISSHFKKAILLYGYLLGYRYLLLSISVVQWKALSRYPDTSLTLRYWYGIVPILSFGNFRTG